MGGFIVVAAVSQDHCLSKIDYCVWRAHAMGNKTSASTGGRRARAKTHLADSSAKTMLESSRGVPVFSIYVLGPNLPVSIYLLPEDANLLLARIAAIPEVERKTYYWTGNQDPGDIVELAGTPVHPHSQVSNLTKHSQFFIKVSPLTPAENRLVPKTSSLEEFTEHVQAHQDLEAKGMREI